MTELTTTWEERMAQRAELRPSSSLNGHTGPGHSMVLIDRASNWRVTRCSECGQVSTGIGATISIDDGYRRWKDEQAAKGWPLDEDPFWTGPIATPEDWFYKWQPDEGESYPRHLIDG